MVNGTFGYSFWAKEVSGRTLCERIRGFLSPFAEVLLPHPNLAILLPAVAAQALSSASETGGIGAPTGGFREGPPKEKSHRCGYPVDVYSIYYIYIYHIYIYMYIHKPMWKGYQQQTTPTHQTHHTPINALNSCKYSLEKARTPIPIPVAW